MLRRIHTGQRRGVIKLCLLIFVSILGSLCPATQSAAAPPAASATRAHAILKQHCYSCHGQNGVATKDIDVLDRNRLVNGRTVKPGSATSLLLHVVENRSMPPTSDKLSRPEIDALRRWVQEGAPDWSIQPPAVVTSYMSETQILALITQDLQKQQEPDRRFYRVGNPIIGAVAGVKAIYFDGIHDCYRGPMSVPDIEGDHPRSIEVWVYNPTVDSTEETMVSWGKRGGPEGTAMAFGYGSDPKFGAAVHWVCDLSWNGVPDPGRWHYLVYTYDGSVARVYADGVEKAAQAFTLHTVAGPINLAAQNSAAGEPQFFDEFHHGQQAGSLWLASVRIYAAALIPDQITATFQQEAKRFGITNAASH